MIGRVATNSGVRLMMGNLQTSGRGLLQAQEHATTGKRIIRMSDNPGDAVSVLSRRAELRRLDQYTRNSSEAQSWLSSADAALSTVSDRLASARTLLIQANSGSMDQPARATIANELRSLRDAIIQSANTVREGRPLFAGTSTSQPAFDAAGVYSGDTGTVSIPVAPGMSLAVNASGPEVFGTTNADPMAGDVFQLLTALATAVENGDAATVGAGITAVDAASRRVSVAQVGLGSRSRQLEDISATIEDSKVSVRQAISSKEDMDLAESIVALKQQEVAYQAALQATARVIQPSLLDFLR